MVERTQLKFYTPDEVADLPEEGDPSIKPGDKFKRKAAFAAIALAGLDVNKVYYHIEENPTHIPIATTIVTPAGKLKLSDVFNLGELAVPPHEASATSGTNFITELKNCIHTAQEYIESMHNESPSRDYALSSLIRASDIVDQISRRF